jgi:hypothetical protein
MSDLQKEREHFALADQHLSEEVRRVAEQIARIQRMKEQGYDTTVALTMLKAKVHTLVEWQEHSRLIRNAIARMERSAL